MESCPESYRKLEIDLHNSCNMSNVIYLTVGIYGLIALPSWYRLTGVLIILISIFSFIHHSNKNFVGISEDTWSGLDCVFANMGLLLVIILMVLLRKTIDKKMLLIVIIMGLFAIALFTVALIAENKVPKGKTKDPVKTWGIGNILTEQNPVHNYETQRFQVLYLSYHSSWHLVSALFTLFAIFAIVPALKKRK